MKEQMEEDDSNRYFLDEEDFPEWNFQADPGESELLHQQ